jgi:hypothetical protein
MTDPENDMGRAWGIRISRRNAEKPIAMRLVCLMSESEHAFQKSYRRLEDAKMEFRSFKQRSLPDVKTLCEDNKRFKPLERMFNFYVDSADEDRLQLWFGSRSMFRKNPQGSVAVEKGLTLLYTLGPSGQVAVVLYPAISDLSRPIEEYIFLGLGFQTAYQLHTRLRSDIADLVAYGYVTSLDGDPTIREKLRVWWLRQMKPMQVDGIFTKPTGLRRLYWGLEFILKTISRTVVNALLKPALIIGLLAICAYFGWPWLAHLLNPGVPTPSVP